METEPMETKAVGTESSIDAKTTANANGDLAVLFDQVSEVIDANAGALEAAGALEDLLTAHETIDECAFKVLVLEGR